MLFPTLLATLAAFLTTNTTIRGETCGYVVFFIPRYAEISEPLHPLHRRFYV